MCESLASTYWSCIKVHDHVHVHMRCRSRYHLLVRAGIKQSGLGRENGPSGIHEFLEEKCALCFVSCGQPEQWYNTAACQQLCAHCTCSAGPATCMLLYYRVVFLMLWYERIYIRHADAGLHDSITQRRCLLVRRSARCMASERLYLLMWSTRAGTF